MAVDSTTDGLLTALADHANISSSAPDSQAARLLRLLNRQQAGYLAPALEKCKGQHKQTYLDITTSASTLRYAIPTRAIGAGIKQLEGVDSAGARWMLHTLDDGAFSQWNRPRNG